MLDKIGGWIWERVRSEWAAVKGAPVTILLLAVIGGWVGYEVSEKLGATEVKNLNTQIGIKDGIISQKESDISSLKYKLDHPDQKPQGAVSIDPDAIYQLGVKVGKVQGASIILADSEVSFAVLGTNGDFDRTKEFSYRDYVLKIKSVGNESDVRFGLNASQTFSPFLAEIISKQ